IVGDGVSVIHQVLLDVVSTVPEAENEVLVPEMRVVTHHVPDNWTIPDGDHRLGDVLGEIAQTHAETATEKHYLHRNPPRATSPAPSSASAARRTSVKR